MRDWISPFLVTLLCVGFVAAIGCGAALSQSAGARVMQSDCISCHPAPEPGGLDRAELHIILDRHKGRVSLSPEERAAVIDALSNQPTEEGGAQH